MIKRNIFLESLGFLLLIYNNGNGTAMSKQNVYVLIGGERRLTDNVQRGVLMHIGVEVNAAVYVVYFQRTFQSCMCQSNTVNVKLVQLMS